MTTFAIGVEQGREVAVHEDAGRHQVHVAPAVEPAPTGLGELVADRGADPVSHEDRERVRGNRAQLRHPATSAHRPGFHLEHQHLAVAEIRDQVGPGRGLARAKPDVFEDLGQVVGGCVRCAWIHVHSVVVEDTHGCATSPHRWVVVCAGESSSTTTASSSHSPSSPSAFAGSGCAARRPSSGSR